MLGIKYNIDSMETISDDNVSAKISDIKNNNLEYKNFNTIRQSRYN